MFDEDKWIEFYREKEIEELLRSIGAIHRFQQDLILKVANGTYTCDNTLRLMTASQSRENVILDVIREKLGHGKETQ